MKKTIMKKWVKALRSGKYKQGIIYLRRVDNTYCCLGVLCDVLGIPVKSPSLDENAYTFGESNNDYFFTELPPSVIKKAGMNSSSGIVFFSNGKALSLAILNDARQRSFKQIAGFIERNWKKL